MPEVKLTRAMREADFSTDHKMILSKISLCIRPKTRNRGSAKKIDCGRLQDLKLRESYQDTLKTNLTRSSSVTDTENLGLAALGINLRKHRDQFDESDHTMRELLQAKHATHAAAVRCRN